LEKTRGHVVFNDPNQELIALSLPNLEKRTIRHRRDSASIYAVAGPDQSGRIVYVENHMMTKTHLLKLMDLVGSTDTVIFEQSGDAIWGRVIGHDIALSPSGEKVAFVGKYQTLNIDSHKGLGFLIEYGLFEVW